MLVGDIKVSNVKNNQKEWIAKWLNKYFDI